MERRQFIKGSAIVGMGLAINKTADEAGLWVNQNQRPVYKVLNSQRTHVGTLPIIRAFAGNQNDFVSPFVMLDEFGPVEMEPSQNPLKVEAHPHAGVTPTTYFLSGNGHHKDSLNYDFQISEGELMMFNSGRGAIHMEETGHKLYEEGGVYHGFQIWLNMPAKFKHIKPSTEIHKADTLPVVQGDGYELKIILGEAFGTKAPAELLSPAFYYHIKLHPNTKLELPVKSTDNAFMYVINGEIETTNQCLIQQNQLALTLREGDHIPLYSKEGAEFLVLGGKPLNEVVYSYGPFVMNTEDQIRQCLMDYHSGKMGDPEKVN